MIPILLGAAVFGAAVSMENQSEGDSLLVDYGQTEQDIDDLVIGRLRSENIKIGNNFITENSRIIRPSIGRKDPKTSAKEWTAYHRKHNRVLKDLYAKDKIADNMRILRADTTNMKRLPCLPHPGGSNAAWRAIPNVYFDYSTPPVSEFRLDNDYSLYDDKVGTSGGMPIRGVEYVWNPVEWFGNPWGPAGQLYHELRTKTNYPSAFGTPPKSVNNDKKVRFGGTSYF